MNKNKMTSKEVVNELIRLRNLLADMGKETRVTISHCQIARFIRACELAAASVAYLNEKMKGVDGNDN